MVEMRKRLLEDERGEDFLKQASEFRVWKDSVEYLEHACKEFGDSSAPIESSFREWFDWSCAFVKSLEPKAQTLRKQLKADEKRTEQLWNFGRTTADEINK